MHPQQEAMMTFHFTTPKPLVPLTMRAMKWEGQEEILRYLSMHGVEIVDKGTCFLLTLSDGTLEARRLPVVWSDYIRLTLPDGTTVDTIYARDAVAIGVDAQALEDFKKQF